MQNELEQLVRWAKPLTIDFTRAPVDVARKLLARLPGAESFESLIEIPNPDAPEKDVLDMRCETL